MIWWSQLILIQFLLAQETVIFVLNFTRRCTRSIRFRFITIHQKRWPRASLSGFCATRPCSKKTIKRMRMLRVALFTCRWWIWNLIDLTRCVVWKTVKILTISFLIHSTDLMGAWSWSVWSMCSRRVYPRSTCSMIRHFRTSHPATFLLFTRSPSPSARPRRIHRFTTTTWDSTFMPAIRWGELLV